MTPSESMGSPSNQEAARLHLLLGTVQPEADGTVIGSLVLHYADGETRPLDLVYGRDVREWWYDPAKGDTEATDRAQVVWTGLNPVAHECRPPTAAVPQHPGESPARREDHLASTSSRP